MSIPRHIPPAEGIEIEGMRAGRRFSARPNRFGRGKNNASEK
ncbi:hypothetical protein HMPREF0262_01395 [Clostridium sp. ATCC 29733]|nr:hypothetical protein HMPREF0262_01395 [Clostridium sp. ATCC 29733]